MGVFTFEEGPALIGRSGVATPSRVLPAKVTNISVQLTSTNFDPLPTSTAYDWVQQAGTGEFGLGIEFSSNAGQTWRWVVHVPCDGAPSTTLMIGHYGGKPTRMPDCEAGPTVLKDLVGSRIRARAFTSTVADGSTAPAVRVGAIITAITST